MGLVLSSKQQNKVTWFRKNHSCEAQVPTCGGRISYIVTPTGLGTFIIVRCLCGRELDISEEFM